MKTTTEVSVSIDWANGVATILPEFDILEDQGVHIINEDGSEELDIWYESNIFKKSMKSKVAEFAKFQGTWIRKPNGKLSNRYPNGQEMIMTDELYVKLTISNGQITGFQQSNGTEHLIDDLTKEIKDLTDPQNPVSFNPKRYEKKVDVAGGWKPMFSTFKMFTNIVSLMTKNMKARV
jgi:hypothetical protein